MTAVAQHGHHAPQRNCLFCPFPPRPFRTQLRGPKRGPTATAKPPAARAAAVNRQTLLPAPIQKTGSSHPIDGTSKLRAGTPSRPRLVLWAPGLWT